VSHRPHPCGGSHITPDDRVLRFCDSDCLRRRLTMDIHDVEDRIRAEVAGFEGVAWARR
jgi:hypothetical protein